MSWSSKYVGLPYTDHGRDRDGVDCWGLARLVYAEELGITLPSYADAYASAEELLEVDAILRGASERKQWCAVSQTQPFDLFEFRVGAHRSHVGIAVSTSLMLHVHSGSAALVERIWPRWTERRTGIYRHIHMVLRGD